MLGKGGRVGLSPYMKNRSRVKGGFGFTDVSPSRVQLIKGPGMFLINSRRRKGVWTHAGRESPRESRWIFTLRYPSSTYSDVGVLPDSISLNAGVYHAYHTKSAKRNRDKFVWHYHEGFRDIVSWSKYEKNAASFYVTPHDTTTTRSRNSGHLSSPDHFECVLHRAVAGRGGRVGHWRCVW